MEPEDFPRPSATEWALLVGALLALVGLVWTLGLVLFLLYEWLGLWAGVAYLALGLALVLGTAGVAFARREVSRWWQQRKVRQEMQAQQEGGE